MEPGLGLNGAVDAGRATIAGKGFDHVVVAHSDLPLADDLAVVAAGDDHARARSPARRHERAGAAGRASIAAGYGAASFVRHLAAAVADRHRVEVRADPGWRSTSTNPADLAHPALRAHLPTWLRTSLDSRR